MKHRVIGGNYSGDLRDILATATNVPPVPVSVIPLREDKPKDESLGSLVRARTTRRRSGLCRSLPATQKACVLGLPADDERYR